MSSTKMKSSAEPPQHLEKTVSYESSQAEMGKIHKKPARNTVDAELAAVLEMETEPVVITEEENKHLRGLVNRRVLSVMLVTYFLQSLDKGTLSFASIMNLIPDTGLVGQQYSWLTTIFYLAILINEPLMGYLVQRLPIAKLLSGCIIAWGSVLCCTAAAHNFATLMVVRFLLGFFEAAVQPAFLVLTSMYYLRVEQTQIVSFWYCCNGVQMMVGGLLAYGVSHIDNPNLKSWQVLFMLLGLVTVLWGCFVGWFLPDSPMRAKCWPAETRVRLVERVRPNMSGLQNKVFKRYQLVEALLDPAVWLLFLLQVLSCLTSGGASAFGNIVITSFGFTTLQTQLLSIAQGGVTIVTCIVPAYLARKTGQTIYIQMILSLPMIAGSVILMKIAPNAGNRAGLLIAFYAILCLNGIAVLIYGLLIRNIGGRTKQNVAIVIVFIGFGLGNCVGPQVFRSKDAPRYHTGFIVYLACSVAQMVVCYTLRTILIFRNARNKKARIELRGHDEISTERSFDDITDRENIDFVYHVGLDKGTLSFASIMSLIPDTGLVGQQYSWHTTIVYLAILINEPLMGYLVATLSGAL